MKNLIEIVQQIVPEINESNSDVLLDDGIIDSLDIVRIVTVLEENYNIEINANDIIPENFNSINSIEALIKLKLNKF